MKRDDADQADKRLLSLKKSPTQERAKSLVDSILEATTRLLGVGPVSTREIAEKAGVGIGSLYEYFPGKEAIFARLIELDLEKNDRRLKAFIETLQGQDLRSKVTAIVDFGVEQFLSGSEFKQRLFKNVYHLRKVRDVLEAWNGIAETFSKLMREHPSEIKIPEERIEAAAYVTSNAVQGLLQIYLLSENRRFSKEKLKIEITDLACSYLLKSQ